MADIGTVKVTVLHGTDLIPKGSLNLNPLLSFILVFSCVIYILFTCHT
jgi:hypothetical protein